MFLFLSMPQVIEQSLFLFKVRENYCLILLSWGTASRPCTTALTAPSSRGRRTGLSTSGTWWRGIWWETNHEKNISQCLTLRKPFIKNTEGQLPLRLGRTASSTGLLNWSYFERRSIQLCSSMNCTERENNFNVERWTSKLKKITQFSLLLKSTKNRKKLKICAFLTKLYFRYLIHFL